MSVAEPMSAWAPRPHVAHCSLFVPRYAWPPMFFVAVLAAVVAFPLYADDSLWIGAAVFTMTLVGLHMLKAMRRVPWLPGFIAIVAALQGVFAPWAAYHLPVAPEAIRMATDAGEYFRFAVPSLLALVAGMYAPLLRPGRRLPEPRPLRPSVPPKLSGQLDALVIAGVAVQVAIVPLVPDSLRFAATLLGYVGYSAAFAQLVLRVPGWPWRVAAILLLEAIICAISGGQFLNLVMWAGQTLILLMHVYRLPARRVLILAAVSLLVILAINGFKGRYRLETQVENLGTSDRAVLAARRFVQVATDPKRLFAPENLAFNAARINQGAITSRIMYWTPAFEPLARGETVIEAIRSAVLPRFLDPDKYVAGSYDLYPRFTGLTLINGTSIGLSIPGEMYANFGVFGGIVGVFVYGTLIGFVFRFFVQRSRRSALWWAWLPMITLSTVSAEQGLGETLNQVAKSLIIMIVAVAFLPAWRTLRRPRQVARPLMAPEGSR